MEKNTLISETIEEKLAGKREKKGTNIKNDI